MTASAQPFVTIAIPTMNGDRLPYLREAVASVLGQTDPDLELLVSQDPRNGVLDPRIRDWALGVVGRSPRARYRFNTETLGLAGHWNVVAWAATGRFVVIIGDDDRLLPGFVAAMKAAARPTSSVVFSNHHIIDSEGRRRPEATAECTRRYGRAALSDGPVPDASVIAWSNTIPMSAAMIATAAARRIGFRAETNTPELGLFIQLAAEGAEFVFVGDYLAEYRVHQRSATTHGLSIDRLAEFLIPLPAADAALDAKRVLLASFLPHAVTLALHKRRLAAAKELLGSGYYPVRARPVTFLVQTCCTALGPVGVPLFRAVHAATSRLPRTV